MPLPCKMEYSTHKKLCSLLAFFGFFFFNSRESAMYSKPEDKPQSMRAPAFLSYFMLCDTVPSLMNIEITADLIARTILL